MADAEVKGLRAAAAERAKHTGWTNTGFGERGRQRGYGRGTGRAFGRGRSRTDDAPSTPTDS